MNEKLLSPPSEWQNIVYVLVARIRVNIKEWASI